MTHPPSDDPGSGGDLPTSPITVFAHADGKLTAETPRMLAPGGAGRSRGTQQVARLSDSTIMMVDDEMINIEMTEAFLGDAGYRNFIWTDDSRQALPMLRQMAPGVLLLDLNMPNIGGLDILAAMQEDPQLRHVPVIVLTSTIDPQVKLQALSAGAMDFLSKPVDPSELGLRIRNTLAANAYREFLANYDPMTGLPNKHRLRQQLAVALSHACETSHNGALMLIGVDGLGPINDALGRAAGDQVLQCLAKRLASSVETEVRGELASGLHSPTLYRFDGDEFAVVVPRAGTPASLAALISKLMEDSAFGFNRERQDLFITSCIGIAVFPQDSREADALTSHAGLALRQAKASGRQNYEFFSPDFNQHAVRQLNVGADLRRAFGRDEIELLYEPRVDVQSGALVGAEAIVQWKHPSGRVLRGDELIEMAANTDMSQAMLEWMFESVQRHLLKWTAIPGLKLVPVGLPLSLAHVRAAELPTLTQNALQGGVAPGLLALELRQLPVDEDAAGEALDVLGKLRKLGVGLTLDRFGSPESSIAALRSGLFDAVKVDSSFLAALGTEGGPQLLHGLIALLQKVGVTCVVCGADTMLQVAFLKNEHAAHCQGTAYGSALSVPEFSLRWLVRRN